MGTCGEGRPERGGHVRQKARSLTQGDGEREDGEQAEQRGADRRRVRTSHGDGAEHHADGPEPQRQAARPCGGDDQERHEHEEDREADAADAEPVPAPHREVRERDERHDGRELARPCRHDASPLRRLRLRLERRRSIGVVRRPTRRANFFRRRDRRAIERDVLHPRFYAAGTTVPRHLRDENCTPLSNDICNSERLYVVVCPLES